MGFLAQKAPERKKRLLELKKLREVLIFMDTPFRLGTLLDEIQTHLSPNSKIFLGFDMTTADEKYLFMGAAKLCQHIGKSKKSNFMLAVFP